MEYYETTIGQQAIHLKHMKKQYNKNINFLPKDLELTSEGGEKHCTELLVLKCR